LPVHAQRWVETKTILNLTCILRCYSASFLQNKRSIILESKQKTSGSSDEPNIVAI
jgi:hypothetical protein